MDINTESLHTTKQQEKRKPNFPFHPNKLDLKIHLKTFFLPKLHETEPLRPGPVHQENVVVD